MYIAILGRQPEISQAELHHVVGNVSLVSEHTLRLPTAPDINRLGGTQKIAQIIDEIPAAPWRQIQQQLHKRYVEHYRELDHKITLGISVYDWPDVSARDAQQLGLALKRSLKSHDIGMRLLPSTTPILSTASVLHNKLGSSPYKRELVIIRAQNGQIIIAETLQVQNIDAYTARDQARPRRDAFVGMLPPKLAQIMINLAQGDMAPATASRTLLDPFCGTGVILQEASLMGLSVYGTDLADKMVRYSRDNLAWLRQTHHTTNEWHVHQADAMDAIWDQPIDLVACETYLGQPFSAPPSPAKLREVMANCDRIISRFLRNIHPQLAPGTPLCIAVPAWRGRNGTFTHLPLSQNIEALGYRTRPSSVSQPLLYHRADQVVARELILLERSPA